MPYSFAQIEENKSRSIQWSLAFLLLLYITGAILIVWVVKYFMFAGPYEKAYGIPPSFLFLMNPHTLLWTIGGAAGLGGVHWVTSTDALIDKTLEYMSGRKADPQNETERVFCNVVEEAGVATGGRYRIEPYIVPTAALNAFALQDFQGRSVIGITEGLLRRLNRQQLEAVVAHEAGHVASGDCRETTVTCVVFKSFDTICDITRRMLFFGNFSSGGRSSSRRDSGGQIAILLLIVFAIAMLLKFIGYLGSLFISREREYRADATAVRLTRNPLALAEALHLIDHRWKGGGLPGENMDAIFILNPRQQAVDEGEDVFSDLFSTHPPIRKRIGILLDMAHAKESDLEQALKRAKERMAVAGHEPVDEAKKTTLSDLPVPQIPIPVPLPGQHIMPAMKDQCPRCQQALQPDLYEGVSVQKCTGCGGMLIGEQDVMRIVELRERRFDERIAALARTTRGQVQVLKSNPFDHIYDQQGIVCPSCFETSKKMTRRFVSQKYPVEIDKCRLCGRVWFDQDELEILQYLYEQDHPSTA